MPNRNQISISSKYRIGTLFILFSLLQGVNFLNAQIVSVEPAIFNMEDMITITYDASQGNAGLAGIDQVYAHTGVITEAAGAGNWQNVQGNWGQADPRVEMTNIGNNLHQISYRPIDYYSLDGNDVVTQLAFVFRNVDGSREGKTSTLGDIFVDVVDADRFTAGFLAPDERQIVLNIGDELLINSFSSQEASLQLFDNGTLIAEGTGTNLQFDFEALEFGDHTIRLEADNGTEQVSSQFSFVVDNGITIEMDAPISLMNGLNRVDANNAFIQLYAPNKESVYLISNLNDYQMSLDYKMNRSLDGKSYWIALTNLDPNTSYAYQFLIDQDIKVADPYSEIILDDFNDNGIDPALSSVPMEYPRALTNGHLSYFKTVKENFDWQFANIERPAKEDLVIYEILMRDFLEDHSFDSLLDTLDYLHELGINAIELMPVSEFENNQSWGYNPSYHMALDKYYGSPTSFKKVVDRAHELGMVVLLDIVYNHAFGQSPLVRMYWDSEAGKPIQNGPYFNADAKHPFNVGFDFNHAMSATQTYVKQTIAYWMEEYKVDGFRFDLSKGFTQRFSNDDSVFAQLDQSRIDILTDYGDFIWDIDPDMILILEHFASNSEEIVLSDYGFLLWGNANFNFNEATMGYNDGGKSNFSHIYHENRSWNEPGLVAYMESHDEERLMYKNEQFGNMSGSYSTREIATGLDRIELASAFFYAVPGPKLLWQFGELGYGFSINRCENGSVNSNCRLAPKPIRWDYLADQDRLDLYRKTAELIKLKRSFAPIREGDVSMDVSGDLKKIILTHSEGNMVVIGNFDVESATIDVDFPNTGEWYRFFSGESENITSTNQQYELKPGEYRIYIDDDTFVSSTNSTIETNKLTTSPNPVFNLLDLNLPSDTQSFDFAIYSSNGVLIKSGQELIDKRIDISQLSDGLFFIEVNTKENSRWIGKFVKLSE